MSFDPNRPTSPEPPEPFQPVAPEATPVPTAPVAPAPVTVASVPGPARKASSSGRLLNVILVVAAAVAIGGVAFAIGRGTASASTTGTGNGRVFGNGAFPGGSFVPGASGAPRFGRGGGFGLAAADGPGHRRIGRRRHADHQDRERRHDQVTTGASTTYHTQTDATAADVQAGKTVQVQLDRRRLRRPPERQRRDQQHPSARPAASPSSRERRGRLNDMHLLVIEDDPRLVRLLRRLLEEDRHVVETATTGQDGLDIAEATTGIEVVVLDLGLPDISGLEVARRHPGRPARRSRS